jgi:N-acetylmuramoyl-L-alanine amidase
MITEEQNAALEKKRAEKKEKEAQDSPSEKREVVMHGASLSCKYAQGLGKLFVTSNELLLQDQKWATEGDGNNMVNLQFKGTCGHPKWPQRKMSPPPCMAVIKLSPWQNLGTNFIQEQKNLVKESYIDCEPEFNAATAKPVPMVASIMRNIFVKDEGDIMDAYFARLKDNKYERILWAGIEEEIYVIVKTVGLVGKSIEINILDREATIEKDKYGVLPVLQDGADKKGEFKTSVNEKGEAVFKLQMKPSADEKAIKVWRDKIGDSTNKKALLCILVDAHTSNPGFTINYLGKNPSSDNTSAKASFPNYFLDMQGKWFELRRKNPVIVIDPGHGYTKGNTGAVSWIYTYKTKGSDGKEVLDISKKVVSEKAGIMNLPQYVIDEPVKWILSVKEDPLNSERFLVYDVAIQLKNILDKKGYITFITRARGPIVGSDDGASRKLRIDIAKNNKADYFLSLHADGLDGFNSSGSHVIYPSKDFVESKELATDIFSSYSVVSVESQSPKIDIRGLQVLSQIENTTKRKILIELGFVTTPKDAKALFSNIGLIGIQLSEGLELNIKKKF